MLFEAKLPLSMWCYATEHSVYLHNRVPTSALPFGPEDSPTGRNITPFAAYRNRLPDLSKLKVFGCQAYVPFPKDLKPQKFKPKMREEEGIWVGLTSAYIAKILDRKTFQIRLSATARVDEYRFPGIEEDTDEAIDENPLPARSIAPIRPLEPVPTAGGPPSTVQSRERETETSIRERIETSTKDTRVETSQTENRDSGSGEAPQTDRERSGSREAT